MRGWRVTKQNLTDLPEDLLTTRVGRKGNLAAQIGGGGARGLVDGQPRSAARFLRPRQAPEISVYSTGTDMEFEPLGSFQVTVAVISFRLRVGWPSRTCVVTWKTTSP